MQKQDTVIQQADARSEAEKQAGLLPRTGRYANKPRSAKAIANCVARRQERLQHLSAMDRMSSEWVKDAQKNPRSKKGTTFHR